MSTSAVAALGAPLLERCFLFNAVESDYEVTGIIGRIPFCNTPIAITMGTAHIRPQMPPSSGQGQKGE